MELSICRLRGLLAIATAGFAFAAVAAPAPAATLNAGSVSDRSCIDGSRGGSSVATETLDVGGLSFVQARLTDAGGNWDLAILDADDNVLGGSAFAAGDEVAEAFAEEGELRIQACRRSGDDPTAKLELKTNEITGEGATAQIVRVSTPTHEAHDRLSEAGFDLTHNEGPGFVDVVAYGPVQTGMLNELGFDFETVRSDLAADAIADRRTEQRAIARGAVGPELPSGRTGTYRQLADYSEEMQALAEANPKLVRYFTLKNETYSGRQVEAIEIAPRVKSNRDGRPTFVMTGAHHAREWPSAEHTLEFAYELINGWKDKSKRVRKLMRRSRVVFVPVVNPDGFNVSRTAGELLAAGGGRDAPAGDETANLLIPSEYHRKNCRYIASSGLEGGNCNQMVLYDNGIFHFGVDPNRNYGGFWGGPGAASGEEAPFFDLAADYRGPGPFSEPETQNIRKLVARRQVTTLITNHTYSNLVLHPPGIQAQGKPRDDKLLRKLSDAMAAENGYESQAGFELYDTSGTTEDWSYNATSGLGYTFEIGPNAFHPTFQSVADEYYGDTEAAGDGNGNRAAYFKALRSAQNTKRHSLIKGQAPAGAFLTLNKRFKTPTSPVIDGSGEEGDVILLPERLKSNLAVGRSGRFSWHVNPSTRPIADPRFGDEGQIVPGKPSETVTFEGQATDSTPCADFETQDPACWNDHGFKVKSGKGIDNGTARVTIKWPEPGSDWDLKVFRDTDGDGSSEGETKMVGSSGEAPSDMESTKIAVKPGKYVARVINYAAVSPYTGTVKFGKTENDASVPQRIEKYTLLCRKSRGGRVLSRTNIAVDFGERLRVNLRDAC